MKQYLALLALVGNLLLASSTNAALIFVGYWDVADENAPIWTDSFPTGPLAFTGQEAAAYLFGGSAAQYTISTVDDTVANINNLAWYDIIGYGGVEFAPDYSSKYLGQYYGPLDAFDRSITGAASAFVRDNLTQGVHRNYAFKSDVLIDPRALPVPPTWSLFLIGLLAVAAARRRKKAVDCKTTA